MSKIISDEEIRSVIGKKAKELEAKGKLMSPMDKFREVVKTQRDSSDEEWLEWIEQHRWESQSLIPGISTIKGYLITDEELQAIRLQAIKQKMEGG